jgi:hypothetical protein
MYSSGLSGMLRRLAYRVPEHRARRWMLLMLADRVDIIEHNPRGMLKLLVPLAAIGLGVFAVRRLRRPPSRGRAIVRRIADDVRPRG